MAYGADRGPRTGVGVIAAAKWSALLEPSPYENDQGELIGRDPRGLTPSNFADAGVPLMPVMKAIRANCIDCCGGQAGEVRKCVFVACPMWPMRMGVLPRALRAAINGRGEGAPDGGGEHIADFSRKEPVQTEELMADQSGLSADRGP